MLVPLTITLAPTIGSPETAVTRPLIVFSAFTGFAEEGGGYRALPGESTTRLPSIRALSR